VGNLESFRAWVVMSKKSSNTDEETEQQDAATGVMDFFWVNWDVTVRGN
jgi:hypothetical protein